LTKRFLFYFCLSFDFTSRDKGSGRPSLVKTDLYEMVMPIPPIKEQERIVIELDSLNEMKRGLETKYQTELDNLEELRQSILEQAFEGKLTEPVAA
jgi:type I restriction enzyme S subunit